MHLGHPRLCILAISAALTILIRWNLRQADLSRTHGSGETTSPQENTTPVQNKIKVTAIDLN